MSYWHRTSSLGILFLLLLGCRDEPAAGVTVIIGNVRDAATDEPLRGVKVAIVTDTQTRVDALSDDLGKFQLQFDAPRGAGSRSLEMSATLNGYRATTRPVEIVRGKPAAVSYSLAMLPEAIATCIQKIKPAVVVGHFRPAQGRPDPDLSERIADTLRYDLLTQIQKANFLPASQPGIFPCGAAEPKVPGRYGNYARLLGADVYIGGYVTSPDPVKVKVQIAVADGYGVMSVPLMATSADVDLDDPQLARLAPEANAAVLTALAIGYKLSDKPQECVDLIAASERLLGSLPEALSTLRAECQAELPNRGLL